MTLTGLVRRVGRRLGAASSGPSGHVSPLLSVIVPAYNVENYLGQTLDSVLSQDHRPLEVVVVDDGSTDSSGRIADDYAGRHPEVRVVHSQNHGLGAARNLGVRRSSGELLTFVDADDIVPPESFGLLVATIQQSGSDFVVGSMARLQPDGTVFHPPWLRRLHADRRLGVTADDFPSILADVFVCNKVFRRTFWDATGLRFPEGVRYEDQPLTTQAYLAAKAFDVIRKPVYRWRVREDLSSITQRRHELDDLRDRFDTKQWALQHVLQAGSDEVRDVFFREVLVMDLPEYFRHLPDADDDYWDLLHSGLSALWRDGPPMWSVITSVHYRLIAWLVLHDRRPEAVEVARFVAPLHPDVPTEVRGDHVVARLPYLDDDSAGIPEQLYHLAEHELFWLARLGDVRWGSDGLVLEGLAGIGRIPQDQQPRMLAAEVRTVDRSVPMQVEEGHGDPGSFRARVSPDALVALVPPGGQAIADVHVRVTIGDITRSGGFPARLSGFEDAPLPSGETGGLRLAARFIGGRGLQLQLSGARR